MSSTPSGLQNQINSLEKASKSLGLTVNLDKTKVMVFRKGGHIAAGEKWFLYGKEIKIVNRCKYLGYTLTTKLSSVCACEDFASKAKGKILDLVRTMWFLGSFDTTESYQLFDAQIKPMLLYASEVWGTSVTRHQKPTWYMAKQEGILCISTVLFLPLDTGLNSVNGP